MSNWVLERVILISYLSVVSVRLFVCRGCLTYVGTGMSVGFHQHIGKLKLQNLQRFSYYLCIDKKLKKTYEKIRTERTFETNLYSSFAYVKCTLFYTSYLEYY